MLPLFHDFASETVLVFGGGAVGLRKARFFAREARTIVLGREFADELVGEPPELSRVRAHLDSETVSEWFDRATPALVVAATDDETLNDAIEAEARDRGVLVNRADRSGGREVGSVVVPATARDGDVVTAVATGGRSPALSRHLRQQIESLLSGADAMADLTAELRKELKQREIPAKKRHEAVRAVVESERVWDAVTAENRRAEADEVVVDVLNRD